MKRLLTIVIFLQTFFCLAQNGINYKALIKDANGNVLSSSPISVQLIIYEGAALTNNVYQEIHTTSTDTNGFTLVNIGEGATSDNFNDIQWTNDSHFLNVQVDAGSGLVDLGTSEFKAVPYAKVAENVSGLEAIDEGNGIGWRLIGSNSDNYGNIGEGAVDLSYSSVNSTTNGATGNFSIALGSFSEASALYATTIGAGNRASEYSAMAMGFQTLASQNHALAMGLQSTASGFSAAAIGNNTDASGDNSVAMGFTTEASGQRSMAMGSNSQASGESSVALGSGTIASGDFSTAIGQDTTAEAYNSTAIGMFNLGGGNPTLWSLSDPLFEIGNGSSSSNRSNALTVLKSGYHIINSSTTGLLVNSGASGILIESQSNGISVLNASGFGASLRGDNAGVYTQNTNDNNPDIIIGGNDAIISTDSTPSADLFIRSNDAVVIELDTDNNEAGNFRVRNGTGGNVFDVNEAGNATLAGSLTQNSDIRLKTNIEDLLYGLKEVLQLQPKAYNWKDNEQNKKSLGLIAQDVQQIISEIVNQQDDAAKTLGISYTELIPVLIKAIQEQQEIIESQKLSLKKEKSINQAQSDQFEALLKRVEAIENGQSN